MDKDVARQKIVELAQIYASQAETYEHVDYNEARERLDFINPLFKILGWDIDNEKGMMQYLREVILEDRVSVDGRVKHPDYSFRLGNTILFYVEAKKPSVNIKDDKESALQLRHYGWNRGLTMSLLTNFREFAVYDCRVKPDRKDKAHVARLTYFTYQDLLEKSGVFGDLRDGFDFLWDTFTQENISRGSFEKFIKDDGDRFKRGVMTVDQDFLLFLEDWRQKFATSIFRVNKNLTEGELNFAVQHILDRVVFLRFAESRSIEPHDNLAKAMNTHEAGECYKNLYGLFEQADDKYNSGIFDMQKDSVCRSLVVDNKLLKQFVSGFYYPNPYDFQTMPVEILGSAYERFLGKTIRIVSGRYATVEEKPEVRKAGGVYYTPQYIVDYIVEHTVGKLLEGKTPKEASKIKIVDPACGSGSFLLGAYQYLLDWHRNYYAQHLPPSKGLRTDPLMPDGHLSIDEKKRILANNIFGVDIDLNAVEFTKLSLLLKCMEGEHANVFERLKIYKERLLPNIDGNIPVGNSLIDTDFYDLGLGEAVEQMIKPFNWQRTFPDVFKQGGFDIVIGNPPYVKKEHFSEETTTALQAMWNYVADLYVHFIFKNYGLAKTDGLISLIVNDGFMGFRSTAKIRELFIENDLQKIIQCPADTFPQATIYTAVFVLCKRPSPSRIYETSRFVCVSEKSDKNLVRNFKRVDCGEVPYNLSSHLVHNRLIIGNDFVPIFNNFTKFGRLKNICSVLDTGMHTGNCRSQLLFKTKERSGLKKVLQGRQIARYCFDWNSSNAKYKWCDINYVPLNKPGIGRGGKKSKQKEYWHWCGDINNHLAAEKILLRQTDDDLMACYINKEKDGLYYTDNTLHTVLPKDGFSLKFVLGLLNSKLLNRIYHFISQEHGKAMAQVKTQVVESIPFPQFDLSKKSDKVIHDKIVYAVEQLLDLYPKLPVAVLAERQRFEGKIAHFETRIDELVYSLYGLSLDEIAIVEGNT